MHLTSYQPRPEAKSYFGQRPQRESQRIMQALGVAMLACLSTSPANAIHQGTEGFGVQSSALDAPPMNRDNSVADTWLAPITIEGERLYPDPTLDDSMRRFRDALGTRPPLILSERQFTDGAMELTTRFGRFCARPLPGYVQPGIGGNITLAARCASY